MWFVVALLMGGAVGYWLPGRQIPEDGIGHLLRWGVPAFLLGLAVAVLHVYPLGDEAISRRFCCRGLFCNRRTAGTLAARRELAGGIGARNAPPATRKSRAPCSVARAQGRP